MSPPCMCRRVALLLVGWLRWTSGGAVVVNEKAVPVWEILSFSGS